MGIPTAFCRGQMTVMQSFPDQWRSEAEMARRIGADAQAKTLEKCAADLEANEREEQARTITLREAAGLVGFHLLRSRRWSAPAAFPMPARSTDPDCASRTFPGKVAECPGPSQVQTSPTGSLHFDRSCHILCDTL